MKELLTSSIVRRRLEERGISVYAVATRLGMHPGHLRRVLRGERPGSAALLQSVADIAEAMPEQPQRRPDRRSSEDIGRLIEAAAHVFFLKRGKFESPICVGAGRRRGAEEQMLEIEDFQDPTNQPTTHQHQIWQTPNQITKKE